MLGLPRQASSQPIALTGDGFLPDVLAPSPLPPSSKLLMIVLVMYGNNNNFFFFFFLRAQEGSAAVHQRTWLTDSTRGVPLEGS